MRAAAIRHCRWCRRRIAWDSLFNWWYHTEDGMARCGCEMFAEPR